MAVILLPNGNAVNNGMFAVTFCVDGSIGEITALEPMLLTKHYTIAVELPKFGQEELAGLLGTAQQIVNADPDFQMHRKDVENYRLNISIVWTQKLDS